MPDYQQGKIYCIRSHQTDEIYIGSTTQPLSKRMVNHRTNYGAWKEGRRHYMTSYGLLEYDDCYIELIEEYPCNSRMELERREGQLIREMDCVNKKIAGRTKKEYQEDNKEKISEYRKQWYVDNKEKQAKYKKQRYEENKEQFKQQRDKAIEEKEYYCSVCEHAFGQEADLRRHFNSIKHQQAISDKINSLDRFLYKQS
jgi:hypothetical protein